jgi:PleD family two-component response regulator
MTKKANDKPRILIVDDLPENIRILIELLGREYATVPATSGAAALKKAQTEPLPDLILLDIMMPEMDGYDVCRALKENDLTRHIPVIFITAVSEVMDEAKAFKLGAVDYVTKPFHPATIAARVKTHLELSRHIRELRYALDTVKTLSGLIPICAGCKKIRDDQGYWKQVESYICEHTDAQFSHGICPDCMKALYPDMKISEKETGKDSKDA